MILVFLKLFLTSHQNQTNCYGRRKKEKEKKKISPSGWDKSRPYR